MTRGMARAVRIIYKSEIMFRNNGGSISKSAKVTSHSLSLCSFKK